MQLKFNNKWTYMHFKCKRMMFVTANPYYKLCSYKIAEIHLTIKRPCQQPNPNSLVAFLAHC